MAVPAFVGDLLQQRFRSDRRPEWRCGEQWRDNARAENVYDRARRERLVRKERQRRVRDGEKVTAHAFRSSNSQHRFTISSASSHTRPRMRRRAHRANVETATRPSEAQSLSTRSAGVRSACLSRHKPTNEARHTCTSVPTFKPSSYWPTSHVSPRSSILRFSRCTSSLPTVCSTNDLGERV